MNHFQLDYPSRLRLWADLREQATAASIPEKYVLVDKWWQHAPLVNHVLHPFDQEFWPDPWELLSNNQYCTLARALGICYTLYLSGETDIAIVLADDDHGNDHVLVTVDRAKYVLNHWPDMVLNNNLADFTVKDRIDIQSILKKVK